MFEIVTSTIDLSVDSYSDGTLKNGERDLPRVQFVISFLPTGTRPSLVGPHLSNGVPSSSPLLLRLRLPTVKVSLFVALCVSVNGYYVVTQGTK